MTEKILCPISHTDRFESVMDVPDRFATASGDVWHIVRSLDSGLVLLNPRPDAADMPQHYDALVYDPFITLKKPASLQDRLYTFIRRTFSLGWKAKKILARWEPQSSQSYRVLDIGCATGDFLLALKRQAGDEVSLDLYGVEPSESAAKYASEVNGLEVHHGELLDAPPTESFGEPFDLITMWHSLEHVLRLNETLEKLHRLLKPDGVLAVAMPNLHSIDAKHYGKHWNGFDAPRHLYHFTPATFEKLLHQHGFMLFDLHGIPLDSFYNCLISEQFRTTATGKGNALTQYVFATLGGLRAALHTENVHEASSIIYYIRKK
ncbi:MAG: class I SAM-dependent methyltransferase [Rhizobacter sp.]|nr:class I SAM-dependent methyltransferase [Chlorobiales bacterium]